MNLNPSFEDLDIDIKLTGKSDSNTTIYVVVYGVAGYVDFISEKLWDRMFYLDGNHLKLEVPINMNNKKITNIDNPIDELDSANKKYVDNSINDKFKMYYYTNNLKHDNSQIVALNKMNKYPFFVDEHSDYMKISKSGFYELTYNDYYKNGGTIVLYDETNNKDLVRSRLVNKNVFTFYSFNAIFQIDLKDDQDHNEISIFIETTNGGIFDGTNNGTFYIKYLHD